MATRNERKRLAKARHSELLVAVGDAFKAQAAKDAAIAARHALINGVDEWGRPIKGIGLTTTTLAVRVARPAFDYARKLAVDASMDAAKAKAGL